MRAPQTQVAPRVTGGQGREAWARARLAEAYRVFWRYLREPYAARLLAIFAVAHWALETGWGSREYNFNGGNIKAYANWAGLVTQRSAGGPLWRAFETIDDALVDYLRLVLTKVGLRAVFGPGGYVDTANADALYHALIATGYTPASPELFETFRGTFERAAAL